MPTPLHITADTFHNVPVARVAGDLVFGHDLGKLTALAESWRAQGCRNAILDVRELTATDSTGLGALLEFRRLVGGGVVYLYQPSERLRTHLTVMHVQSIFVVADSEDDLRRYLTEDHR